jgi:hypothetical protein
MKRAPIILTLKAGIKYLLQGCPGGYLEFLKLLARTNMITKKNGSNK